MLFWWSERMVSSGTRAAFVVIRLIAFAAMVPLYTLFLPVLLVLCLLFGILVHGFYLAFTLWLPFAFIGAAFSDEGSFDRTLKEWKSEWQREARHVVSAFSYVLRFYARRWRWVVEGPSGRE